MMPEVSGANPPDTGSTVLLTPARLLTGTTEGVTYEKDCQGKNLPLRPASLGVSMY